MGYDYEEAQNASPQGKVLWVGSATGNASLVPPGFAQAVSPTSIADRLSQFIQLAHESGGRLASVRERLCGPWPESASGAQQKPAGGQIENLMDELQAALIRVSESATVINNRV